MAWADYCRSRKKEQNNASETKTVVLQYGALVIVIMS